MKRAKALAVACLLATTLTGGAGVADAGGGGADLKVASGSVKAKGGELRGSFRIKNSGGGKAKASIALLTVEAPGKDKQAERYAIPALGPGETADAKVRVAIPAGVPAGKAAIDLCADSRSKIRERSEKNNCSQVGKVGGSGGGGGGGSGSSVPDSPIQYPTDEPFQLKSSASDYWAYVPSNYDGSHQTPTKLFVWSHGCGGDSGGDIFVISPGGAQDWISVSVGGRDGECWDPAADQDKVLKSISSMKTHFNIDPRTVILGGYSSGGDLSYRTAFEHSGQIAGVLAENTSPFRDTGLSQANSLAAATSKFHVVHLAHLQDEVYGIDGVRSETDAMTAAGFPLQRIEVDGTHFDNPGANVNGKPVPGTDADIATYLLPHIGDGWTSPG